MTGARPLPSWSDGPTRDAILAFVESVSSGPDALPEAERVAVFDNDGTLWTEKPMPVQLHFIVEGWKRQASADPSLADRQPYRAAVSGDLAWLGGALDRHYAGDDTDLKQMIGAILGSTAHESVERYAEQVAAFYREARHPVLHRPYREAIYQPMLELLRHLEQHGFTTYLVSGGDRDFMRPMSAEYYGIPVERVIGSAVGLEYDEASNEVRYGTAFDFMDDGPEKPIRIWTAIGRRPILAAGNSNGDVPMLTYVGGAPRSLSLLVHHDDDTGRGDQPYDAGAEQALAAASEHGFTVVSVRRDWATVFPADAERDASG
ncbi:HAD family hydrolase [Agromyces sp. G08B096]|uniref:HAD family hydrolase n=1 Tax=Agromyces sp. G08B096 TaxID=3156399 RepID=A0AAU7W945_9MICO